MTIEFKQRFITSIFLILLLYFMLNYSVVLISVLLLLFVFSWIEFNNLIEKIYYRFKKNSYRKFFFKFLIFFYLLFFIQITIIEFMENLPDISWNLLFVILICILSDLGGYVFGKTFKGKKLTKISPNKTYSGMIGSFLFPLIFSLFYSYSISFVDFKTVMILSLLISGISQSGDLLISLLKRKAKVKDTSNILPGHGGLLDRIDGMLLAIPFGMIIFNFFIFTI